MIRGRGGGVAGIPGKGARQVSRPARLPAASCGGGGSGGRSQAGSGPGLRDSEDLGFSVTEAGSGSRVLSRGRRAFNRAPSVF